ncbi:MAG: guanylate kinase [Deltaproteobacteria bacterium]|nr:guanylate kinase [Deltaproteobacteria bacterium]
MEQQRSPIVFCFCGPIACGKSTITKALVKTMPSLALSISTTTRTPRVGELDGREYHFVSDEEFQTRVDASQFIEHAIVSGYRYGTEKRNAEALPVGSDLVLEIDFQGALSARKVFGEQVVVIFVTPPSFAILRERLSKRGDKGTEYLEQRLALAEQEINVLSNGDFSDYLLLNDSLDAAIDAAKAIVAAERHRYSRYSPDFIRHLSRE